MKQKKHGDAANHSLTPTQQELIRRCINSDPRAQETLYSEQAPRMLGLCYRYTGSLAQAELLLQQGFVSVFTSLHLYRFSGDFHQWITGQIMQHVLDWVSNQHHLFLHLPEPGDAEAFVHETDSDSGLHSSDIVEMMVSLPTAYRVVLNLYSIEGLTQHQICEALALPEHLVASYYTRARMLMARLIAAKGRLNELTPETVTIYK